MTVQYESQASDTFFSTAFDRHWKQRRVDKLIKAICAVGAIVFLLCAWASLVYGGGALAIVYVVFLASILGRKHIDRFLFYDDSSDRLIET